MNPYSKSSKSKNSSSNSGSSAMNDFFNYHTRKLRNQNSGNDDSSCAEQSQKSNASSVSFSEAAPVVHNIDKIKEEFHHDIWYSDTEYDRIRKRVDYLVEQKERGTFRESSRHTFLGLEQYRRSSPSKKVTC